VFGLRPAQIATGMAGKASSNSSGTAYPIFLKTRNGWRLPNRVKSAGRNAVSLSLKFEMND
jgi:hypothetical protein